MKPTQTACQEHNQTSWSATALVLGATIFVLTFGLTACGGASHDPPAGSQAGTTGRATETVAGAGSPRGPGGILKSDGDPDADDHSKGLSNDDQDEMVLAARRRSGESAPDRQAVETIVKRYFAAGAAGDGATGCSLLYSSLATAVAAEPGQPRPGQSPCAASLSRLFARQHQHLAAEQVGSMVVTGVHISGAVGYVTLGFKQALESEIIVRREHGKWTMDALFDSTLP
jgi:hypothetical protein